MSQDDFDSVSINVSGIGGGYDPLYGPTPPLITVDPGLFINGPVWSTSGTGPTWTTTGTSGSWILDDTTLTETRPSGKLTLQGEDADIEINGRSLMQILDGIEQRLGLLKTHESMEAEWAELRAIGDQYRAKLAEIENKVKMWDTLKR